MSDSSLKILRLYHYDALDRLTDVGLLADDSTQRFYQENHLVTELGQQTQRTILRHEAQPMAQQQSEFGVRETTLLATDQAHSLLHSLAQTNSKRWAYTAYGHYPAESGLSRLLGFNGECPDAVTGHYLLGRGKRAFNPVLMRFNSPDELGPFDKEAGGNAYAYCNGDPTNFYDPTGNMRASSLVGAVKENPLRTISTTASSISRSNQGRHKTLKNMLDTPISNAPRSVPSTSTSTSQLVSMPKLAATKDIMKLVPFSSRQTPEMRNLQDFGEFFDRKLLNDKNFNPKTDTKLVKALDSQMARLPNTNESTIILHYENSAELMLKMKHASVKNFLAPTVNQQIRTKFP